MSRKWLAGLMAPLMVFALSACDVDVNDPGEAPDIEVEEGRAPDVEVTPPDVDVDTERKKIEVPDVDITPADENEPEQND